MMRMQQCMFVLLKNSPLRLWPRTAVGELQHYWAVTSAYWLPTWLKKYSLVFSKEICCFSYHSLIYPFYFLLSQQLPMGCFFVTSLNWNIQDVVHAHAVFITASLYCLLYLEVVVLRRRSRQLHWLPVVAHFWMPTQPKKQYYWTCIMLQMAVAGLVLADGTFRHLLWLGTALNSIHTQAMCPAFLLGLVVSKDISQPRWLLWEACMFSISGRIRSLDPFLQWLDNIKHCFTWISVSTSWPVVFHR